VGLLQGRHRNDLKNPIINNLTAHFVLKKDNNSNSDNSNRDPKIYGYIYRIYHYQRIQKTNDKGENVERCYIGKTTHSVAQRFNGHKRDAENAPKNIKKGIKRADGKLHKVMWAEGIDNFRCEEIDSAHSPLDLSNKEKYYQEKYQSIKYGLNKIAASSDTRERSEKVTVMVYGIERKYESPAHMCRELGISYSTYLFWTKKKLLSIKDAVSRALEAKKASDDKLNNPVVVFRRPYPTLNDAVRDQNLNKYQLNEKTIRQRIRGGMTYEEAFHTQRKQGKVGFQITTPDGKLHEFKSLVESHQKLAAAGYPVPPYSSVVQYYRRKKHTPEQAFGYAPRPWEAEHYAESDKLMKQDGYKFIGRRDGQSKPVILHATKEIFGSVKSFAKTFNIEYTSVAEEYKRGLSAEEILRKRKHPAVK